MTRDEILSMAREAGGLPDPMVFLAAYERFAEMVEARATAAEREACAKVCDRQAAEWDSDAQVTERNYAGHCANLIRARSKA